DPCLVGALLGGWGRTAVLAVGPGDRCPGRGLRRADPGFLAGCGGGPGRAAGPWPGRAPWDDLDPRGSLPRVRRAPLLPVRGRRRPLQAGGVGAAAVAGLGGPACGRRALPVAAAVPGPRPSRRPAAGSGDLP